MYMDHVMPREKRCGALDRCFGLVGPHHQSIPQLLPLASRVYKGYQERSICHAHDKQEMMRKRGSGGLDWTTTLMLAPYQHFLHASGIYYIQWNLR